MPDGPWDALGIAPTSDRETIRRAYAARLKTLDVDRDPAAFMRLREAYDELLVPPPGDDVEPVPYAAPSLERAAPVREDVVPYGALETASEAFRALVVRGATREASAALEKMLARGIVPLGAEEDLVRELVACALADATLTAGELEALARTFDAPEIGERAAALRWRTRIEADVAASKGLFGFWARYTRRPTRVARALFGEKKHDLFWRDLPALRVEVQKAGRYARWLPGFVDPDVAERKLVRLERTLRGEEIMAIIAIALLLAGLALGAYLQR